jgi:hypothetical protein
MSAELIAKLHEVIAELATIDVHQIDSDGAHIQQAEDLLRATDRLDGVIAARLQVMHNRQSTTVECGRATKAWLVEDLRRSNSEATRRMVVARALPTRAAVDDALAAGEINLEHAHNIVRLLKTTPAEMRDVVEKALVEASKYVDPTALGQLCRKVKESLGLDEDRHAADQRRYDSRWLTVSDTIDGMVAITGMLDPVAGQAVKAALRALAAKGGEGDTRTSQQRRADALASLAQQALNSGELPEVNGERPHLNCTVAWDALKRDLEATEARLRGGYRDRYASGGVAVLDGTDISIGTARMLACDANILPVVMGANGEVLDLGRSSRTWSKAQLRALLIETGGKCGWPKCQGPADHAHHIAFWAAHQGPTAVTNGVFLCWYHHHLVHQSDWTIAKAADATITVGRDPASAPTGPPGWHP